MILVWCSGALSPPHGEEPRDHGNAKHRELPYAASRTMTGYPADIVGGDPRAVPMLLTTGADTGRPSFETRATR
jgi:hypothetical protein